MDTTIVEVGESPHAGPGNRPKSVVRQSIPKGKGFCSVLEGLPLMR